MSLSGIEKLQKIEQVIKVGRALEQDKMMEVALLLGLTPELTKDMSIEDIFDALTVRMANLLKEIRDE